MNRLSIFHGWRLTVARNAVAAFLVAGVPSVAAQTLLDFGDAPDPKYPTLLASNGARHARSPELFLGNLVDLEPNGQPTADALGDDGNPSTGADDEDGVLFPSGSYIAGQMAEVEVIVTGAGRLDAWADFDDNGDWNGVGERIFASVPVGPGSNTLMFSVPANSAAGTIYSRWRLSSQGGLQPAGAASDGEVEDHIFDVNIPQQEGEVDVSIAKSDSMDPVQLGDSFTYTLVVENAGPNTATGVAVSDQLPAGVLFVSAAPAGCTYNASAHLVKCSLGSIPAGGSASITIEVSAVQTGHWNNRSFVTSNESDTNPSNNFDAESTLIEDDSQSGECDPSGNKSLEFWITYPGNYAPDPANRADPRVCLIGPEGTKVTVEVPGLGWSRVYTLPVGMQLVASLPRGVDLGSELDTIRNLGVHITAEEPIAVFGLNLADFSSDGFLALPVEALGREYLVQAFGNLHSAVPELNGTQFAFVATQANTEVTITLPFETLDHPANEPFTVLLQEGDTYQLRHELGFPRDLTGTHLLATQPIAVFGGHECANVPDDDTFFCDYLVEQIPPTRLASVEFAVGPLETRAESVYRVLAVEDGTAIEANGAVAGTLDRGEYLDLLLDGPVHVTADRPVLLSQVGASSDHDGVERSDPLMMNVPAVDQWIDEYMVCVPDAGFDDHYLNLVVSAGDVGATLLDGVSVLGLTTFEPVAGTGYEVGRIPVTPGAYNLNGPSPFGVHVYGFALRESYGYPGGMLFGDTQPPVVTCEEDLIVRQLNEGACETRVPSLVGSVTVEDNCPGETFTVTQDPPARTLVGPGTHIITVSAVDTLGNVGTCDVVFEVIGAGGSDGKLEILCPKGIRVRAPGLAGAVVDFSVLARAGCDASVEVACEPASGSLFPLGRTWVQCTASSAGQTVRCEFPVDVGFREIKVVPNRDVITLDWEEDGGILEAAPSALGPWQPVADFVQPPYQVNVDRLKQRFFFRVRHPEEDGSQSF